MTPLLPGASAKMGDGGENILGEITDDAEHAGAKQQQHKRGHHHFWDKGQRLFVDRGGGLKDADHQANGKAGKQHRRAA